MRITWVPRGGMAQSRSASAVPVVEASKLAELESAQAAAQAALMAELDLLRRQKAAAEEQSRRLESQVPPLSLLALLN